MFLDCVLGRSNRVPVTADRGLPDAYGKRRSVVKRTLHVLISRGATDLDHMDANTREGTGLHLKGHDLAALVA
jgi:hypothetical protein